MRLRIGLLMLSVAAMLGSGCGANNNGLSANANLTVLPTNVIIAPGPQQSCLDVAGGTTTSTVTGPLVAFPKFRLDWTSTDHSLIISTIRVTVTGAGITGGSFVYLFPLSEIQALLGKTTFPPNHYSDSTLQTAPAGDNRAISRGIPPCSLTFGGITLANGMKTGSFKAQIKVDLIGEAVNADLTDQQFIKATVNVTADYTQI